MHMHIHLCYNYYHPKDAVRRKEIDACLEYNIGNPHIDHLHIIVDTSVDLGEFKKKYGGNPKINILQARHRPTFYTWLKHLSTIKDGKGVGIIANSDIAISHKCASLLKTKGMRPKECYALTRYNTKGLALPQLTSAKFYNRQDSQDTWCFSLPLQMPVIPATTRFCLGVWGCDNRFAAELMYSAKYSVRNPSKTYRTYHYHTVPKGRRKTDKTVPPPYKRVPITF